MSYTAEQLTGAAQLAALRAKLNARRLEPIPEGWRTVQEWAKEWCVGRRYAQRMLDKLTAEGMAEVKPWRKLNGNSAPFECPHYRLTDEE